MTGVHNRLAGVICEVGTCCVRAAFTEFVMVIPGEPDLKTERHHVDIVLCQRHESEFQDSGLLGTITAYGDEVVGPQGSASENSEPEQLESAKVKD